MIISLLGKTSFGLARLILFAVVFGFGTTASADDAEQFFRQLLEPRIRKASTDVRLYHSFAVDSDVAQTQSELERARLTKKMISSRTEFFWRSAAASNGYMNAGPGLYAGLDPHSIFDLYGGAVLVLRFTREVKYLDLTDMIRIFDIKRLEDQEIAKELRCNQLSDGYCFEYSTLERMLSQRSGSRKLRSLIQKLFTEFDVVAVRYPWSQSFEGSSSFNGARDFCGPRHPLSAIVYFGTAESPDDLTGDLVFEGMLNPSAREAALVTRWQKDLRFLQSYLDVAIGRSVGAARTSFSGSDRDLLRMSILGCVADP